jgi:D-serine deaminase-like pyridoxal phosphate-dependent protein
MEKLNLTRPALLIDEQKCRKNISAMAEKAGRNGVVFRPHFKTHVSHEIGRWFREYGVEKITVSSLEMAAYFAEDGWKDITVAFPVNILEIETINRLAKTIVLNLLFESDETVALLAQKIHSPVNAFIKIDVGSHRTGILYNEIETIDRVLNKISESCLIRFTGFLTHAGNSYQAKDVSEIRDIHHQSINRLKSIKNHFAERYPGLILSTGDTPTCSIMEDFSGIDEIRPGNFVFYDLMQCRFGSCSPDQIAVAMACPVVAIHPERDELVIYGGAVHFSKERIENSDHGIIYGQVAEDKGNGWGNPVEGMVLAKLSQEHGIVQVPPGQAGKYRVGNILKILPVHSCLTSQLAKFYLTTGGRQLSRYS